MLKEQKMQGIACGGNWIVDQVKFIDNWPPKCELANILEEDSGTGGGPANVLTSLKRLGFSHPTFAIGCIGRDAFGEQILGHCRNNDIGTEFLAVLPDTRTSYTDVMTIRDTGERTFFHCRGANAKFAPEHVPVQLLKQAGIRMFYLGYLLLLDTMDRPDPENGTVAAGLLQSIHGAGIETCLDVVSEASERFQQIVVPSLRYVDHCIINEIEAGRTTGIEIRKKDETIDQKALRLAAKRLLELGVKKTAVIHFPEGSLWCDSTGTEAYQASLKVPKESIVSSVGAGDAFCAGVLYGIHEDWSPEEALTIGSGSAAACLHAANTTDGVRSLGEIRKLCVEWS
jgi:sugar/nucleoside kinase (ribokinase family)